MDQNAPQSKFKNTESSLDSQEAYLSIDECFVSRTDSKGIIVSGNDVFVRVSGYTRPQLIGSPHNIIRHPDMPKAVFKLLWETIQSGKPIVAYVKNKAIDGRYYWVMASVFPIEGGYLSIRIKPTSGLMPTVEGLYAKMLEEERTRGVGASTKILVEALGGLGFKDYTSFSVAMMREELGSRDRGIADLRTQSQESKLAHSTKSLDPLTSFFVEMGQIAGQNAKSFATLYGRLGAFDRLESELGSQAGLVSEACVRLDALSVNMAITAKRLGRDGVSLSIVSGAFQKAATEVMSRFNGADALVAELGSELQELRFLLGAVRIQSEMLSFFMGEVLEAIGTGSPRELENLEAVQSDTLILIEVVGKFFGSTMEKVERFSEKSSSFSEKVKLVRKVLQNLDVIRLGGRLESAKEQSSAQQFLPFIEEMHSFENAVAGPVLDLERKLDQLMSYLKESEGELRSGLGRLLELDLRRNRIAHIKKAQPKRSEQETGEAEAS